MELPEALAPFFSSAVVKVFRDSSRVSKAVSQLAVPLVTTTVFEVRVISWPKGSAAACGDGAAGGGGAVEGKSPGDLVSAGGGAGVAAGDGAWVDGVGDCARTDGRTTAVIEAIRAIRNRLL